MKCFSSGGTQSSPHDGCCMEKGLEQNNLWLQRLATETVVRRLASKRLKWFRLKGWQWIWKVAAELEKYFGGIIS